MRYRIFAAAAVLAVGAVACGDPEGATGAITESPTAVPGMEGGTQTEMGPAVSEQPDI